MKSLRRGYLIWGLLVLSGYWYLARAGIPFPDDDDGCGSGTSSGSSYGTGPTYINTGYQGGK